MIRYSLIVEAAALTAAAVVLAAAAARWAAGSVAAAAAGAFATLIAWRALANALSLNADFIALLETPPSKLNQ